MPEVTEEKSKDLNDGNDDPAALVESKDKKKRKKLKRDSLFEDGEKGSLRNKSKVDADKVVSDILLEEDKVQDIEKKRKEETMEKSVENVEDGANEYKRASKKRKRLAHDEDGKHPVEEVAVEESKRRKTDGRDEAKGVEQQVNGSLNGVEKSSQPKSTRKQINSSAEPKMVNAFQRVKVDDVKFVDERLQDNSYLAKDGAETGYGAKAQEILGLVRGRDFRHEKTKKKRGSYRGGQIDLQSHSIKFNYSDED
ncbi:nucleolar and coiled-body phosphoprotein 1-like [Olea europaea var. sylvestris]|uniref:nucleolar and coiled-body phosphoprotein 1-like n=1 Tax=Olea europaea var. sylvestris TaxID=158386 RepID=UPI000C1CE18D|nr:nucleolar and coiled-body phosphoprotein 1-like [Olea europaea var. sylvestris]XP_022851819.1 nucleolar and coiled-body phosphoprotein 1-like [Olea europaea var. sylvestris]XP_022851820.1 nucleolar and coiled-body phosphoprotein 1-like [Olea europaea var. sylvestris]XP_022851821.1 nucleolar and coiled-body phosphoprotein 1-like [Olea europaea var. sylvestris]XP_022851823.1 nucleolar and coiled-body phosphoprotein 1-like [Olea europaea var. sylvestris]XP_022851824.1 nucleolar and coiled-body